MKNLKRLLSLALAGTMLCGMMVMGASATNFPDDEDIVNQEAVASMVALNIINGKDDGEYHPEDLVTRAEMAKMIATAMNGGIAPNFGTKPQPTYTDIKGNWAEQYVEYCADMKIVSGRGAGIFDPAGNVTGVEAAKMVLTALGYDATAFQLTGADWAINTAYVATTDCDPSLYEGLTGTNMNVAITRDTAAQLIWNGVQNNIVTRSPDKSLATGEVTYKYETTGNPTLLKQKYDADITIAQFKSNSHFAGSTAKDGQVTVIPVAYKDNGDMDLTGSSKNITADVDVDLIGEIVKVIWRDEKNTAKGMDPKDTIYGVFTTGETEVVRSTRGLVGNNKVEDETKIKVDGTKYDLDTQNGVNVYWNYTTPVNYKGTNTQAELNNSSKHGLACSDADDNSCLTRDLKAANGDAIKLVLNDGNVTDIYVTETKLGVVTAKTADKITVSGLGTLTIKDHSVYEDAAKNDVVAYTHLYDASTDMSKGFVTVKKAEVISGTIDRYKTTETVTVDGETYNVWASLYNAAAMPDGKIANFATDTIGEDFDLYMVNGYVAGAVQVSESADNYSLVIDIKSGGSTSSAFTNLQLQVMDMEGNKSIITVSDDSAIKAAGNYHIGDIVTYTTDKNGEAIVNVEKAFAASGLQAAKGEYNADTKTLKTTGASWVTTGDCVLFVATEMAGATPAVGDTFKAYKIRDLKSLNTVKVNNVDVNLLDANKWTVLDKDGKAIVAFAAMGRTPDGATAEVQYGIVTKNNGTTKIDKTPYNTYSFWNGEEEITVNINANGKDKDNNAANTLTKGHIYGFVRSKDDTYSNTVGFWDLTDKADTLGTDVAGKLEGTDYKALPALVKEYVEKDGIITIYNATGTKTDNAFPGASPYTYAVDKDVKIVYVDVDADAAGVDNGVDTFNSITGYANVILVKDKDDVVKTIIVETSGKKNIWE